MKHDYHIRLINPKQDYTLNQKPSSCYRILYLMEGKCLVSWEKHTLMIPAESLLLIPQNISCRLNFIKTQRKVKAYLGIFHPRIPKRLSQPDCTLSQCFDELKDIRLTRPGSDLTVVMISLLRRLILLKSDSDFGRTIYQDSCLGLLFVLFNRSCLEQSRPQIPSAANLPINEVCHFILDHFSEELSLDQISDHFYISKYTLCRKFKEKTGDTIHQYILSQRLDHCRNLLEQGLPVKDIYHRCGFHDYNHLFRAFKKEFGMTPKDYSRNSSHSSPKQI